MCFVLNSGVRLDLGLIERLRLFDLCRAKTVRERDIQVGGLSDAAAGLVASAVVKFFGKRRHDNSLLPKLWGEAHRQSHVGCNHALLQVPRNALCKHTASPPSRPRAYHRGGAGASVEERSRVPLPTSSLPTRSLHARPPYVRQGTFGWRSCGNRYFARRKDADEAAFRQRLGEANYCGGP